VNRQLKRLGAGLMGCYLALFAMVNYIQVFNAESLEANPRNFRTIQRNFDRPRGQIVSADGVVLARTEPSQPGDPFETQRVYPEGSLFGQITGYINLNEATGIERSYNDELVAKTSEQQYQDLGDLLVSDDNRTGEVQLTIRKDLQETARAALAGANRNSDPDGAVVAIDPRNGEILALWGNPTFDPNALASHKANEIKQNKELLSADPNRKPLLSNAYQERYFPGSTFKVVTAATGLSDGVVNGAAPVYPPARNFDITLTSNDLDNFGGSVCGGALEEILRVSCNSAFADMGVNTIGQDRMVQGTERFGFNARIPLDLPGTAVSQFPTDFPKDQGNGPLARASIGQGDNQATPLQMALVAAASAGDGTIMAPHVMKKITDNDGVTVKTFEPKVWKTAMSPQAAADIKGPMIAVVQRGSGKAAIIPNVVVGGKSGTAQLGLNPPSSHAWFVAWAAPAGGGPATVAVAVFIRAQPGNANDATGGGLAAPVAKQVIQKVLEVQANPAPSALSAPAPAP
jgi:peptidoglycan glycosyltransferase